jgi:hypothetical protein
MATAGADSVVRLRDAVTGSQIRSPPPCLSAIPHVVLLKIRSISAAEKARSV